MNVSLATSPTLKQSLVFLAAGLATAAFALFIVFSGLVPRTAVREPGDDAYGAPTPIFRIASFDALPGWKDDDLTDAFPAFLQSCDRLTAKPKDAPANPLENLGADYAGWSFSGDVLDWLDACDNAHALAASPGDDDAWNTTVRRFFETNFTPVEVLAKRAPLPDGPARNRPAKVDTQGVFTGYFEPGYEGRRTSEGRFTAPVYSRPDDLIDVDLGRFRPDLAGARIAGRIEGARLIPYPDHGEINDGAVEGRAEPLAYLDPNDLLFLQIQGSGRITLEDGTVLRVGYDGTNGHPYTAVGRVLVSRGHMTVEETTMQTIRTWLDAAADEEARALREENASYVFFRELPPPPDGFGPPGAQGAPLKPGRSLAVDRRYHTLGAPVFVDIEPMPDQAIEPIRRLMIAQDTGGAIRGPVRGDFFWGAGEEAAQQAGAMNARGRLFVLLPKARADALAAHKAAP